MKINTTRKTLTTIAVASLTLLTLTVSQALAQTVAQRQQQSYPPPQSGTNQSYPNRDGMMGRPGHHGGMGGWGHNNNQYGGMYNLNTVETIRGKVVSTNAFTPMNGMSQGMQLLVETEDQTVPVHLAPSWYLDNQGFQVNPGDEIEVKGSQVNWAGNPVIMVAEVRQGDKVLELRDDNGIPAWSGNRNWNRQGGWGSCCW
ncbi:hypothetical protein Xen7305DRAFT_00026400 [Xenococcus sp. PCC 7305]|uniref:hypothetical protein n=1 Tax=Xenococcus sp. PCC 7305 TaxID=102125 RepID=UPI0002ABC70F|nr:hypothetical protein [Xenococcus sp. PCC 7305]ELS02922.1 hypothetical protein Xen7305DRAFT_00026400 [Xenococcus sp. PCC 7305]